MSCKRSIDFYGSTIQAGTKLLTNRIDGTNKNRKQINIGGCADKIQINGDLHVTGQNCANCLQTNDPDVSVNISGSNPPVVGQSLVSTSGTSAEWQNVAVAPASSTDNEIVRYDGTTGRLIKSDSTDPTLINDNGEFFGPKVQVADNLIAIGNNINKTAGPETTVLGNNAGTQNTASNNTFIGFNAGNQNTTGNDLLFVGYRAGENNTTASDNTFVGKCAGEFNTTGNSNTFIGHDAGEFNTTGSANTFIGNDCGVDNISGDGNVFIGDDSGRGNISGSFNTFVGKDTGESNTTGSVNVFLGNDSGERNTTGTSNTFLGADSGESNIDGNNNVLVGYRAGRNMTSQSNCVILGFNAGTNNTLDNRLMVDNSTTNEPLLDGNFSSNTLQVNGTATLGQTGNVSNVHNINGLVDNNGNAIVQYLVVNINGQQFRIPLYNSV